MILYQVLLLIQFSISLKLLNSIFGNPFRPQLTDAVRGHNNSNIQQATLTHDLTEASSKSFLIKEYHKERATVIHELRVFKTSNSKQHTKSIKWGGNVGVLFNTPKLIYESVPRNPSWVEGCHCKEFHGEKLNLPTDLTNEVGNSAHLVCADGYRTNDLCEIRHLSTAKKFPKQNHKVRVLRQRLKSMFVFNCPDIFSNSNYSTSLRQESYKLL
ncbi:hypothetical protein ACTXT7_005304 [Hymenolepis weldensis]